MACCRLPPAAYALIADRVHVLVSHGSTTLQLSLVITSAIALWSSSTGTKSMVSALNQAYSSSESRNFFVFQLIGLLLTLGAILAALIGLVILIGLPPLIQFIGLSDYSAALVRLGSLAVLVLFVLLALAVLYRVGPSRRKAQWQWFTPGALLATLGWLIASVLVSYYGGNLATYDATYGPLGAVAGVMMWFYVSAYVVLAGAELNAALEAVAARR
jgi:membrane protein